MRFADGCLCVTGLLILIELADFYPCFYRRHRTNVLLF